MVCLKFQLPFSAICKLRQVSIGPCAVRLDEPRQHRCSCNCIFKWPLPLPALSCVGCTADGAPSAAAGAPPARKLSASALAAALTLPVPPLVERLDLLVSHITSVCYEVCRSVHKGLSVQAYGDCLRTVKLPAPGRQAAADLR